MKPGKARWPSPTRIASSLSVRFGSAIPVTASSPRQNSHDGTPKARRSKPDRNTLPKRTESDDDDPGRRRQRPSPVISASRRASDVLIPARRLYSMSFGDDFPYPQQDRASLPFLRKNTSHTNQDGNCLIIVPRDMDRSEDRPIQ